MNKFLPLILLAAIPACTVVRKSPKGGVTYVNTVFTKKVSSLKIDVKGETPYNVELKGLTSESGQALDVLNEAVKRIPVTPVP